MMMSIQNSIHCHIVFFDDMDIELKFSPLPIEALADSRLSKTDLRVLGALHYRNGQLGCFPSRADICEITRLHKSNVSRSITNLARHGWLQKNGREFILAVVDMATIVAESTTSEVVESTTNGSGINNQKSLLQQPKVAEPTTRNRTKENSKRKIKEQVCYPPWLNLELWKAWKETRQTGKTKYTKHAEKLGLNKLQEICPNGENHEAVINQAIEHGWKSFYKLKPEQHNGGGGNYFDRQVEQRIQNSMAEFLKDES